MVSRWWALWAALFATAASDWSASVYSDGQELVPLLEVEPSGLLRRLHAEAELDPPAEPWDPEPRVPLRLKRSTAFNGTGQRRKTKKPRKELGLDLLVLVDFSLYARFLAEAHGDAYSADAAVHRYFTNVLSEVGRLYASVKTRHFSFRLYPAGVVLAKRPSASPWIHPDYLGLNGTRVPEVPLDAYSVLQRLKKWLRKEAAHLPEYDHVVAFTRQDLHRFGDGLAQGIAYVKSICHKRHSVSLAEDVGASATVAVIAHELAHSLGAEHDGTRGAEECPVNLNYLMVPSVSSQPETLHNTFRFSACSLRQIDQYLKTNKRATKCLYTSPREGLRWAGLGRRPFMAPGQVYDAHQQCRQAFGPSFRFCQAQDYYLTQMCRRLWCRDTRESRFAPCLSKHYLPAFFGTSCGHRMWCLNGACVEDVAAPARDDCRFGDRDSAFCVRLLAGRPDACAQKTYSRFCCKTCRNLKVCVEDVAAPARDDCRFGDRDSAFCVRLLAGRPDACAQKTYSRFCCKTCRNLKVCVEDVAAPARDDCRFGDRDSAFCVRLLAGRPDACAQKTYSRFCCKTCRSLKVCVEDVAAPARDDCRFGDRDSAFCVRLLAGRPDACAQKTYSRFCCKTCRNLKVCVEDVAAPARDDCRFGDRDSAFCVRLLAGRPDACAQKTYSRFCCKTCRNLKVCVEDVAAPARDDCRFGDRDSAFCVRLLAGRPDACAQKTYSRFCCKTCRNLKVCVEDVAAPARDDCRFGDRDSAFCVRLLAGRPDACAQKTYSRFCCKTCRNLKVCVEDVAAPARDDCRFGDRDSAFCVRLLAGRPDACAQKTYSRFCCKTCRNLKVCVEDVAAPARDDCRFGDRDSAFCVRLLAGRPDACAQKTYSRFCCKTCRNLKVFGATSGLSGYRFHHRRRMSRFRFLN